MTPSYPQLLVADGKNRLYPVPDIEASGMAARHFFRLGHASLIKLPAGTQLFALPDRHAVGFDRKTERFLTLDADVHSKKVSSYCAVGAFLPPGYTGTYSSAYSEKGRPKMLPLFAYTAVALFKNSFYASAIKVDNEHRHDPLFIDPVKVAQGVKRVRRLFPKNRLVSHLAACALSHGCPGAQNFFLHRHEGPLPCSGRCNAQCLGCISYQPKGRCPATQPRIAFSPTPEEISEVALFHIANVRDPIVSFGQGCDGEPLLAAPIIARSIRLIRNETARGIIHANTNASQPKLLSRLIDLGLNSIRVSLNSARKEYYTRYYKPRGYNFDDVIESLDMASRKKIFVSINYLTMPGFTDHIPEARAFAGLIAKHKIDMVQWRNLNYDPVSYFQEMRLAPERSSIIGIRNLISSLSRNFPDLMMGYYNPARRRMKNDRLS